MLQDGLKLHLYDGSNFRCEFVVADSTKINNLKIVLQGNVNKKNWTGVKVHEQSKEESVITNNIIAKNRSKYVKGNKVPLAIKSCSNIDYEKILVVIDGRIAKQEERFITPSGNILTASISKSPKDIAKYGEKARNGVYTIETQNGTKNALILLNDKEISHKELLKIVADPLVRKSLRVLRDKSEIAAYGEKGKNGVVIVTTNDKKFRRTGKVPEERMRLRTV